MVCAVIHFCGAYGGHLCGPTPANRKGQFENVAIRNAVVKPYLKSLGADVMGQDPLPDINHLKPYPELRKKVSSMIVGQGYTDGPWFLKEAKVCLIWPIWKEAFPNAKWVLVRRRPVDIANSCLRTGFMRSFHSQEGWLKWVDTHMQRFEEMKAVIPNIREVWPSKFVSGDFTEIQSVVEWLGLQWNDAAVREFVTPDLWTEVKDVKSNRN